MALYVREVGPTDAATILLIPGGGTGGWFWEPQAERLSGAYHVLIPDLPEQGQSIEEGPFTISDAADRMAGLIRDRAHGGRAHVAGLSLGAQVIVQMLVTCPDLIIRALISGANVRGLPGAWLLKPYFRLMMPFRAVPLLLRLSMKSGGIPDRYYPHVLREAREMTLDALTHITLESLNFRLPDGLEHTRVPVLILVGQREPGAIRASQKDLCAAIPSAECRVVPRGIHAWNMQFPDLFTETLRAWIENRPLPAELLPL
jgi:pimeloyl-ACP methyl ester carboxylesterase